MKQQDNTIESEQEMERAEIEAQPVNILLNALREISQLKEWEGRHAPEMARNAIKEYNRTMGYAEPTD